MLQVIRILGLWLGIWSTAVARKMGCAPCFRPRPHAWPLYQSLSPGEHYLLIIMGLDHFHPRDKGGVTLRPGRQGFCQKSEILPTMLSIVWRLQTTLWFLRVLHWEQKSLLKCHPCSLTSTPRESNWLNLCSFDIYMEFSWRNMTSQTSSDVPVSQSLGEPSAQPSAETP